MVDVVVDWFKRNNKNFKLVDKVDNTLLVYVKILKKNPSYIKCIELVKASRFYGRWIAIESEAMIKLYTANTYIKLNKALRKVDGIKLDKELRAMKKLLDNALDKLPTYKQGDNPLLRSVFFTEKEITKLFKVGKGFVEKGFKSTTYSEKALQQWLIDNPHHNVIFKVFGKNGKLIEKASVLTPEAEVLFKSGTKFIVKAVNKGARHPIFKNKKITEIILIEK